MGLFDFFRGKSSSKAQLASVYTDVHSTGGAFTMKGRHANLWEATNPKGGKEFFVMDHEICWNTMCSISNRRRPFNPDPDDFVFKKVDLSEIGGLVEVVKEAWVFHTLV